MRSPFIAIAMVVVGVGAGPAAFPAAAATEPNQCVAGGQGQSCSQSVDCASNNLAFACVAGTCQVPCDDAFGERDPTLCAMGEACVPGTADTGDVNYCQVGSFSVDLNLLDMCINYFVDGTTPTLGGTSYCSLDQNLGMMLDQDGSGTFNIFDVDGCISSYLYNPACGANAVDSACLVTGTSCGTSPECSSGQYCATAHGTCALSGESYCEDDADCGSGLYCDVADNRCVRECGYIGNRESGGIYLERPCFGRLKTCDYGRGKCVDVDLSEMTCQVDSDCPNASYCFLGQCTEECFRDVDCPAAGDWSCNANRCKPAPSYGADAGFVFEPEKYAVHFVWKKVEVTEVNDRLEIPQVIMNLHTRKEVVNNPAVSFGYRLSTTYAPIENPTCDEILNNPDATTEQIASCTSGHEFLIIEEPFGTGTATRQPVTAVRLDTALAATLSEGIYRATLNAIYSNGTTSSTTVEFRKQGPSGTYAGQVSVYLPGLPDRAFLGNSAVSLELTIDEREPARTNWNQIEVDNNLDAQADLIDITQGYPVYGYLSGTASPIFQNPIAGSAAENRVAVKGLYSPDLRRMHLVAVIDLAADYCTHDQDRSPGVGACVGAPDSLSIRNFFARDIRRLIHFIGPYDATTRTFHGIYREKIMGLMPSGFTLDGGFRVVQIKTGAGPNVDDLPPDLDAALVAADSDPVFPAPPSDAYWQAQINEYCGNVGSLDPGTLPDFNDVDLNRLARHLGEMPAEFFASESDFDEYLGSHYDTLGPILPQLMHFEQEIQAALEALGDSPESQLTIFEYLQGQVFLCSEDSSETCINEDVARCGLALYRKAILNDWVGADLGWPLSTGFDLFCAPGSTSPTCTSTAAERPNLVAYREHNRFYSTLSQALRYQAASDISDAFFKMYHMANQSVDQALAVSEKQQKLQAAWARYQELVSYMLDPVAAQVLWDWPILEFKSRGRQWIQEMQGVLRDRADVLTDLVDLKRRIFVSSSSQDYIFVQNLLHLEYLAQAFLLELQHHWEGEQLVYAGYGPDALAAGQRILNQVNESRNPLGFHPNQVFFENSAVERTNWRNYLARLRQGGTTGGGLIGDANALVNEAVNEMRGALTSKNSFEAQLLSARHVWEDRIDQICGDATVAGGEPQCGHITQQEREEILGCTSAADCGFTFACSDPDCRTIIKTFRDATGTALDDAACRVDTTGYEIEIGGEQRPCMRGQVGTLIQERAQLELQRDAVYRQLMALAERVDQTATALDETQTADASLNDWVDGKQNGILIKRALIYVAQIAYEIATASAQTAKCSIIVGMAAGGDCMTAPISAVLWLAGIATHHAVVDGLSLWIEEAQYDIQDRLRADAQEAGYRQMAFQIDNMSLEVQNLISQYQQVVQQLFNLEFRINDNLYLAQQAANHYTENISQIIDHLLGTEQGAVLRRNAAVMRAEDKFREALVVTYKMAVAFAHAYNLEAQNSAIQERVFQIVTVSGINQLVDYLEGLEADYCGAAGIDCDTFNNLDTLRFSLRGELFGNLTDIVDPDSGNVLTRGEQFHNIVTSSAYRKKRVRGPLIVEQIEIPFSTFLQERTSTDEPSMRWLISPLACNHVIAGHGSGTMAVNVVGTRLQNLNYEIVRGNTDYIRGCDLESIFPPGGGMPILDYPISTFTVGYAPHSSYAQGDVAPVYTTRSGALPACRNRHENSQGVLDDESCYRYFARDRSLSAIDWKLVIPVDLDSNGWIMGDGLPDYEKPIIEDIVLYIRNRNRPTSY